MLTLAFVAVLGVGVVLGREISYGDVDGNDVINAADVTLLRRYIASTNRELFRQLNPDFNEANADANGDGVIDERDVTLLRVYLAAANPDDIHLGPVVTQTGRRSFRRSDFPADARFLALTFDDGPNTTFTVQILDNLYAHGAFATFYVNPYKFDAQTLPVIHRMIREGHDVENHTFNHTGMGSVSAAEARADLQRTSQAIFDATGFWPFSFRAPFFAWGHVDLGGGPMLFGLDRELNMAFVDSGLDPSDFNTQGAGGGQLIANRILTHSNDHLNGGNILLHDCGGARPQTVEAVRILVPALQARGFEIVTVRELFMIKEGMPETLNNGTMWPRVNQFVPVRRGQHDPRFPDLWPNHPRWFETISTNGWYTNPIPPWERQHERNQ
jgi:peptidoglycan/xylan/chitin deacetylase (PgdA/CDA1 family)